jgi:hypothetical protein
MNRKKQSDTPAEMLDRIISVAYGDASLSDRIRVMIAASGNKEVRDLLIEYRKTAGEVRLIREEEVPRELLKSVKERTVAGIGSGRGFANDLLSLVFTRPLAAAAANVILIAAIVTSLVINKPVEYKYTQGQVAAAEKQTKYALALVGKIFKETHMTLEKEVLEKAVAKPFQQSVGIVNNLLEGDKNETN